MLRLSRASLKSEGTPKQNPVPLLQAIGTVFNSLIIPYLLFTEGL